ncbi:hypothetical protein C8Q77DRAFT_1157660 [Trametes polyzona]|nr:hypothetical protein C8Q77DRAFT_1157660 [Trametes polyzona]
MESRKVNVESSRGLKRHRAEGTQAESELEFRYPQFFLRNTAGHYRCVLCQDHHYEPFSKAYRHEFTDKHTRNIRTLDRPPPEFSSPLQRPGDDPHADDTIEQDTALAVDTEGNPYVQQPYRQGRSPFPSRSGSLQDDDNALRTPPLWHVHESPMPQFDSSTIHGPPLEGDDPGQLYDNWGGELAVSRSMAGLPDGAGITGNDFDDIGVPLTTEYSADIEDWDGFEGPVPERPREAYTGEASKSQEPSESWQDTLGDDRLLCDPLESAYGPVMEDLYWDPPIAFAEHAPDIVDPVEEENIWWPWPNREACLMDVMGAFPRALFSESELRAARWLAEKTGARSVPTIQQVKRAREAMLKIAGIEPMLYQGNCGHLYATTEFEKVIQHEFANPVTRACRGYDGDPAFFRYFSLFFLIFYRPFTIHE